MLSSRVARRQTRPRDRSRATSSARSRMPTCRAPMTLIDQSEGVRRRPCRTRPDATHPSPPHDGRPCRPLALSSALRAFASQAAGDPHRGVNSQPALRGQFSTGLDIQAVAGLSDDIERTDAYLSELDRDCRYRRPVGQSASPYSPLESRETVPAGTPDCAEDEAAVVSRVFDPARTKKPSVCGGLHFQRFLNSGGGIRTRDLRVMSPTSYQTAPPRGVCTSNSKPARRVKAMPDGASAGRRAPRGGCRPPDRPFARGLCGSPSRCAAGRGDSELAGAGRRVGGARGR